MYEEKYRLCRAALGSKCKFCAAQAERKRRKKMYSARSKKRFPLESNTLSKLG